MGLAHDAAAAVGRTLSSIRAGEEKLVARRIVRGDVAILDVTSPDFHDWSPLPKWATGDADGRGHAPTLVWNGVPANAKSIAVVCEDPDAPLPKPFVHWLVYGIHANVNAVGARVELPVREGENSALRTGFTPAAPPPGHGLHHYYFQVFALDRAIELEERAGREALVQAMRDYVVGYGQIIGTYERK